MNFIILLRNISLKYQNITNKTFYDKNLQLAYLHSLPEPKTNLDRSFLQYKCQCYLAGKCISILRNCMAMPLLLYYLAKCRLKNICFKEATAPSDAVFLENGLSQDIIPQSLKDEYSQIEQMGFAESLILDSTAFRFIVRQILVHPFAFFFNLKNTLKIAMYCSAIKKYKPKAIITYTEVSFCSSILTDYCNSLSVEHINVMHGEKLFTIRDAFFGFNRYYVWDQHYIHLFQQLRVAEQQFYIDKPKAIFMNLSKYKIAEDAKNDFVFYLEHGNEEKLSNVREIASVLIRKGCRIKVRPHPRSPSAGLELKYFDVSYIENPYEVDIERSIASTQNVVGCFSTVLYQALNNNVQVIIDDMTNPDLYSKLKILDYIMMDKPHKLLSDIISDLKTETGDRI